MFQAIQHWYNTHPYQSAFLCGVITALSLPPIGLVVAPAIGLSILLSQHIRFNTFHRALLSGWAFGTGYFMFGLYWTTAAFITLLQEFVWFIPFSILGVPALLGSFWAAAFAIAHPFRKNIICYAILCATLLAGAEYARAHFITFFPWNILGYGAYRIWPLMQSVSILGIYGLTLFLALISIIPFLWVQGHQTRAARNMSYALIAITLCVCIWGSVRMINTQTQFDQNITVQIIQPNIPQDQKEDPDLRDSLIDQHIQMMDQSSAGHNGVFLSIWPETVFSMYQDYEPEQIAKIAAHIPKNGYVLLGIRRIVLGKSETAGTYNSLVLLDQKGQIRATYDKHILSPWGEQIPHEAFLRSTFLNSALKDKISLQSGSGPKTIDVAPIPPFQPQICFESAFAGFIPREGPWPEFITLASNDDWTLRTTQAYQSFVQSQVRAIETGLPILRSSNAGISAVIDAQGRVLHAVPLWQKGVFTSPLPISSGPTFYVRWGDTPALIAGGILIFVCVAAEIRRRRHKNGGK